LSKHIFSSLFTLAIAVTHYFHFKVEKWIAGWTGVNFATYIIYGLLAAFFLIALIKALSSQKTLDIGIALLAPALIFFFIFTNPLFTFKLSILEMIILGIILAFESKKSKSPFLFIIIAVAASAAEIASNLSLGSHFYYLDAWRSVLMILSGFVAGSILIL